VEQVLVSEQEQCAYAVATLARVSGGRATAEPARALGLSASPEAAKISIDRMTFFSDAVVAIAMTLLALDLPVPPSESASELSDFVSAHDSEYLAFLISFFVIAQYWRAHHRVYRYVTDAPSRLVALNVFWLLTVILTPYATRVIYGGPDISHSDFPWRFGFYALVQGLAGVTFFRATRYIERLGLFAAETPPDLLERSYVRSIVLMAIFFGSIPLAFWLHGWAFVVWGLFPVGIALGAAVVDRRHRPTHRAGPA
jgi:uncharacterized membrane protein